MSKDLMELVDGCPISETSVLGAKGEEVISEYRKLGFTKATEEAYQKNLDVSKRQKIYGFEYRVITTEAIRKFLQRKVKLYDKEHKPKPKKKSQPDCNFAEMAAEAAMPGFFQIFHGIFSNLEKLQDDDVFNIEHLERAREELRRSGGIPSVFLGRPDHSESGAQEQLAIHRQRCIIEAEEHHQTQRVNAMNQVHQNANPIWCYSNRMGQPHQTNNTISTVYEKTCDYDKLDPETIGRFEWKEERVEDYDGLPPVEVLDTFKEHKSRGVFDYFTIASVNSVPDPLLLGRIDGDDGNRWFITQWSNDVCLDDLI